MMQSRESIYTLATFREFCNKNALPNPALVYGSFHIIHPGHLRYFQHAKSHGSTLVVALSGNTEHPDLTETERFTEAYRAAALAQNSLIDYVVILGTGNLNSLLSFFRPPVLILGTEFESDRAHEVQPAVERINAYGGRVIYQAGEVKYSTSTIGREFDQTEQENWTTFTSALLSHNISLLDTISKAKEYKKPNVLVIGDTILDEYIACDPIGLSREAPVVVVKELKRQPFLGGAAIVAAHLASFGAKVSLLSVTGADNEADIVSNQLAHGNVISMVLRDETRPTTLKTRYLVDNQKLFRVSRLREHNLSKELEASVIDKLHATISTIDAIVVSDFVYGMITNTILSTIVQLSRLHDVPIYGDLQCSSHIGNVAKFRNFQLICPTEREARIALSDNQSGIELIAHQLIKKTNAENLILKLGGEGFICYDNNNKNNVIRRQYFPPLTLRPTDVTGAGDSLLATVAFGLGLGCTLFEAAALASCSAAISVRTVGNIPVTIHQIESFITQKNSANSV